MIKGDRLIINKNGITMSSKRMEDIRAYKDSKVYLLPLNTFEYRSDESAAKFPIDIFITSIPPEKWPFVMRFNIRLINRPGTFKKVYKLFEKLHINVLSSETIRSGHHHDTLNVLGEIMRLGVKSVKSIFEELDEWKNSQEEIYENVYKKFYDILHVSKGKFESFKNQFISGLSGKENLGMKPEEFFNTQIKEEFFMKSDLGGFYIENSRKNEIGDIFEKYCSKKLGDDIFEEIANEFNQWQHFGEEKSKHDWEFDVPMWYDIIKAYTEKTAIYDKKEKDFEKIIKSIIVKECKNIEEFFHLSCPEELKSLDKKASNRVNTVQYGNIREKFKTLSETVRNIISNQNESDNETWNNDIDCIVDTIEDLKTSIWPYIKREYDINTARRDLPDLIALIGMRLKMCEKNETEAKLLSKLKSDKQMMVCIQLMTEPAERIKFSKMELSPSENKKAINDHLEKTLDILHKRGETKEFNRFLGYYLAYLYLHKRNISIDDLLEEEIKRAHPKVYKLSMNSSIKKKSQYLLIEREMLILKALLSLVVTYKKLLSHRYKLLLVEDSLDYAEEQIRNGDEGSQPSNSYIYNIRYYKYIFQYPFFADKGLLFKNNELKVKVLDINKKLDRLPRERENEWPVDPRYNMDPITISPVETLSHAFYHRVYDKYSPVTAEESFIPFPPGFHPILLNRLFSEENTSTYGIASFNSDAMSCRICPIPTPELPRFVEIELEKNRNCHQGCAASGREYLLRREENQQSIFEKVFPLPECKNNIDSHKCIEHEEIYCHGSSMGLMSAWLEALSNPIDPIEYGFNFNIWRTFNKTTRVDDEIEKGGITVWARAIKKNFTKFPKNITSLIQKEFEKNIGAKFPHGHLRAKNIKVNGFFSHRIFVSLPFNHPMHEEWLNCIKRIGKAEGFSEVLTTATLTKPVTKEVAEDIRKSIAMIQILSLPQIEGENLNSQAGPQNLEWLYAEYLTAVTYELKVIRLLDITTIKDRDLRIGRDHMTLNFSRLKPFAEFEQKVKEAFETLKGELLNIYKA